MYLAYIAPHFPLQARPEDIQKYKSQYSKGYAHYRNQRFEKQKRLGVISPSTKLSPPEYEDWNQVENQTEEDLKMAVYAAQVDRMDQNIGRLIEMLKKQGVLDNTIIFFLSDNGGADTNLHDFPDAEIGSRNCWSAYGKSWGNVSNTPYRKFKAMVHEGGIITPMVVHWPAGIESKGQLIHDPVHITDLAPTIFSIVKTSYPNFFEGKDLIPQVGENILPIMNGENLPKSKSMFFEHQGNQAVRQGDWKLVRRHKQDWELYNLREDPTELTDLSDRNKDKKQELLTTYRQWAEKNNVMEWPITN